MPDVTEDQMHEIGKLLAPFLTIYVATQLTAARYQGLAGQPSSAEWRQRVLAESCRDAIELMKII